MHRQELHHRARLMRLLLSKIRGDICVWPIIPDSSRITIPGAHDPCRRCDDPGGHVVDEAMQLRWPLKHRRHGIAVSSNPDGVEVAKTLLEQVRRFPSALSRNPLVADDRDEECERILPNQPVRFRDGCELPELSPELRIERCAVFEKRIDYSTLLLG